MKNKIPKIKDLYAPIDYYGKSWIVATITKDDLVEYLGKAKARRLTDKQMSRIAEKVGDAIMDSYWVAVDTAIDYLELKKKGRK